MNRIILEVNKNITRFRAPCTEHSICFQIPFKFNSIFIQFQFNSVHFPFNLNKKW